MTSKNNRAPPLYYIKLCVSFKSHWWIPTGATVRKHWIWVKIVDFFVPGDLEIWQMTLKNNRAPLPYYIKLCASFHSHWWLQTGVTVRKRLSWVLTSLTFDLWPWPFPWTSLLSLVINPENFMMIRWWEHSQKGVTDGRTVWTIHIAAWSQLKTYEPVQIGMRARIIGCKLKDKFCMKYLPGSCWLSARLTE